MKHSTKTLLCVLCAAAAALCVIFAIFTLTKKQSASSASSAAASSSAASSAPAVSEYGTVDSCADGIVHVSGLSRAKYGELLEFAGDMYGIALDMSLQGVSAALLSSGSVPPGSVARG